MRTLYFIAVLNVVTWFAQAQKFTVNGAIKDLQTGENLIGATIFNPRTLQGTTTNTYGFYSFTQIRDSIYLRVSFVGYEPVLVKFILSKDTTINIGLNYNSTLKEVVITSSSDDKIQENSQMGTIDVPLEQIKALPAFLGEVDVFKVFSFCLACKPVQKDPVGCMYVGEAPTKILFYLMEFPFTMHLTSLDFFLFLTLMLSTMWN